MRDQERYDWRPVSTCDSVLVETIANWRGRTEEDSVRCLLRVRRDRLLEHRIVTHVDADTEAKQHGLDSLRQN